MKKLIIMLLIFVLSTAFVYSVVIPDESNTVIINKIDQEHKNTRQFTANELSKRQAEFINDFTTRADYYEETYHSLMRRAVWQLGLLWTGIMFFFISINKMISTRTEEKKYQVLKEAIKKDIYDEFKADSVVLPKADIDFAQQLKQKEKTEKKSFFGKMVEKKDKPKKFSSKEKDELMLKMAELLTAPKQPHQYAHEQKPTNVLGKMKQ